MSNSQTPSTLIIAEAGVNHNGDMELAHKLIDVAAEAGANLVKFQTFRASELVTPDAPKAKYQADATNNNEGQLEMLRALELSAEDHRVLFAHCENRGVAFLSTAFDDVSTDLLNEFVMPLQKIPSGEITNVPYLRRAGARSEPIVMSSGMATLAEIEFALDTLCEAGAALNNITVLHCNTQYPTPFEDVNLKAMQTIRAAFPGIHVGYSDHTQGVEVPIAAVAMGASVIEKHFTIDRTLPGPDHAASLEPDELKAMVSGIRNIERALGTGRKAPSPSEAPNLDVVRKSIVSSRKISEGELFSEENLATKRPGGGLSPTLWDATVGRTARRAFAVNERIEW
jgi:N,N'-diacetyllegionaminate synthase